MFTRSAWLIALTPFSANEHVRAVDRGSTPGTDKIDTLFIVIDGPSVLICHEATSQQFYMHSYICIYLHILKIILFSNIS